MTGRWVYKGVNLRRSHKKEACVVNKKSRKQHGVVVFVAFILSGLLCPFYEEHGVEAANGSVTVLGLDSLSLSLFPPKQWVCIHTLR